MTTTNRLGRRALLPGFGLLLTLLLVVTACSSGGNDLATSEAGGAVAGQAPAPADGTARSTASDLASGQAFSDNVAPRAPALQTRAVISTGTVTLRSGDVGQARFDVQKVVDAHRGEITDEQTETDTDGRIDRSRLVIRVPSQLFDEAMTDLGDVAELRSAQRTSEDVTTEVIDVGVRVRAQEKSLERIELLLARAQSLRDVIAIESQLTRRQADLDSLKAQQAYLADQTSLATITVFLEKKVPAATPAEEDQAGFVAGLQGGWGALREAATVLATGLGAVLPFTVVLVLLGVPLWLLLRSLRRRRAEPLAAD